MNFKIGDLVQIVSGITFRVDLNTNSLVCEGRHTIGMVGTVIDCWPSGECYDVKVAHGETISCGASVLRLIPGDTEGRQLVDFDWRSLVTKQPEIA